jgi:hypothetical protein
LKGSTGAIRDIHNVEGTPIVLTCGLDRYLRVFNYKTYEDMPQIYMKTKLNVLYPLDVEKVKEKEEEESELDEEDEMLEEEDEMDEGDEEDDDEDDIPDDEEFDN